MEKLPVPYPQLPSPVLSLARDAMRSLKCFSRLGFRQTEGNLTRTVTPRSSGLPTRTRTCASTLRSASLDGLGVHACRAAWGINKHDGHLKLLQLMIDEGHVDVNVRDARGKTLLDHAIQRQHMDFAKFLAISGWLPVAVGVSTRIH